MSLAKTELMWVGHQREELNTRLDGKEIKQVDGFVYFGGMVTEDGHSEAEVRRGRSADTSGSECLEKGRGNHAGQKNFEKAERESPENVCYTRMLVWSGDSGIDRTTTTDAASL